MLQRSASEEDSPAARRGLPEGFHIKALPNFAAEFLSGAVPTRRTIRCLELPMGTPASLGELKVEEMHHGCRITETGLRAEKLRRFAKDCSWAIDHVYFGGEGVAQSKEKLDEKSITHIVNCVRLEVENHFDEELKYLGLYLQDSGVEDIRAVLYDVFDFIEEAKEEKGRVFVHCSQGVSRSAAIVIAYAMWRTKQSFEVTKEQMKAQRGVVDPNVNFCTQLMSLEKCYQSQDGFFRMYRLASQGTHQPTYLVPKSVHPTKGSCAIPESHVLDPRGTFVLHGPKTVFIWIGSRHLPSYLDSARKFAHQLRRYENAAEAVEITEGSEPQELFDLLDEQSNCPSILIQEHERYTSDYDRFTSSSRLCHSMKEPSRPSDVSLRRTLSES